ncbi:hypothetical protein K438DRAFT_1963244 [Mycena galopus ATCC 62051]|nr:hypothetical protein K438DRAFT_1963244 [Mycena galopus ATCC 62051]
MFPGPYSYGQPFYHSDYNYHQLNPSSGYVDGYFVRDYSYGDGYGGYGDYTTSTANFPVPQPELRQRTPTPPPPPAEPSPEYFAASLSAQPTSLPPGQRKLLIFDLNGTLLLRSPRNFGQRKIYPRPYARALVAYLAHPLVFAWLDCMVWSSAQAHNVAEMVNRIFGTGEGAGSGPILRAVWARDTLGLGREAFHQKTQTTKDLAKPWAFFAGPKIEPSTPASSGSSVPPAPALRYSPSAPSPRALSPPPMPPPSSSAPQSSPAEDDSAQAPASTPPLYPHGPHTTLLVDDSPLKARLQPWNHLCVGEYDAPTRARDLAAARLPPDVPPSNQATHPHMPTETHHRAGSGETSQPAANAVVRKERWRKRRKREEDAATANAQTQEDGAVVGAETEGTNTSTQIGPDGEPAASVQVQGQSKRSRRRERKLQKKTEVLDEEGAPPSSAVQCTEQPADELAGGSGSSDLSLSPSLPPTVAVEPPSLVAATIVTPNGNDGLVDEDSARLEIIADSQPTSSPTDGEGKKRKRQSDDTEVESAPKVEDTAAAPACTDSEPYDPTLLAVIGVLSHVRSVGNVASWVRSGGLAAIAVEQDAGGNLEANEIGSIADADAAPAADAPNLVPSDPAQWFASRRLLVAWAARGRTALAELGIDAVPGVE